MQSTSHVFLVKPASFHFNAETAVSNAFQKKIGLSEDTTSQKAIEEFDAVVSLLKAEGVSVHVFKDTVDPPKPDAIFPNNWVSLHADETVVLYPMCAPNRRPERRQDIIDTLKTKFKISRIIDLSAYEIESKFLEGTGSIVFDHQNKIAYACLSPRTDRELFINLSLQLGYKPVHFVAHDKKEKEIYHTNVMMCIGNQFTVICLESITNSTKRKVVFESLNNSGLEIIEISLEQMNCFAGNMLLLRGANKDNLLVISQSAMESLNDLQRKQIGKYARIIPLPIKTIETIGGGSARCMIAEIFLPEI
ncbi:hypothetical protein WSM22_05830 [Cytophagales bacterium WSM2-2]|nr:hypothetical protein WSM22_05830 [Cytophagales bacterium WSM2-2]